MAKPADHIQAVITLLEVLNGLSDSMTIKQARALMGTLMAIVEQGDEVLLADMQKSTHAQQGVNSRWAQLLVRMKLVVKDYAPGQEKTKVLRLAPKGHELVRLITAIMKG